MTGNIIDKINLRKEIPLDKPIVLIVEVTNIYQISVFPINILEHGIYKHAPPHNMTFMGEEIEITHDFVPIIDDMMAVDITISRETQ